jgi:hypothetical protein
MPNSDLVPYYKLGSSQDGPPDELLSREECKRRKKANIGHYACHGNIFQEDGPRVAERKPFSSRFGAVHDVSVSPGERIVFAYCYDNANTDQTISEGQQEYWQAAHERAVAVIDGARAYRGAPAVKGWIRPGHQQECSL